MRIPDGWVTINHLDDKIRDESMAEVRIEQTELVICKHCEWRKKGRGGKMICTVWKKPVYPEGFCYRASKEVEP